MVLCWLIKCSYISLFLFTILMYIMLITRIPEFSACVYSSNFHLLQAGEELLELAYYLGAFKFVVFIWDAPSN